MASPVADAYNAPSGADVYAGRYPGSSVLAGGATLADVSAAGGLIGIPAWRAGLTPLQWVEVGSNVITDINPASNPAINPNHPGTAPWAQLGILGNMTGDWSGGAWDETNQIFWVLGGGHSGYLGNEPYTIDLDADSPIWIMRGYPTGSIQRPVTTVAARDAINTKVGQDGRPLSVHTYDALTVLSDGRLFCGYGPFAFDASGTEVFEFNPVTNDYDLTAFYSVGAGVAEVLGGLDYDPVRNKVWHCANRTVTSYDVATRVATRNYLSYSGNFSTGSITRRIPEHDLLAVFTQDANAMATGKHVCLVDPTSPGSAPVGINATTQNWALHGICYDTTRKRFMHWHGGATVDTLEPPVSSPKTSAWTYGSLTTSTAVVTPSAAMPNGTYGRFRYSAKYDCAIAFNKTTEKLYVLPLS